MDAIKIRKVNATELEMLQDISRKTFHDTFAVSNSEENMQRYLKEAFSIEQITSEFNDPGSEFYFAVMNAETVGYLKLNFNSAQTDLKDERSLEIERIYVVKEFQGKKVGQILFDKAVEIALQKRLHFIWLGVWEENLRAIKFYKKNGFEEFGKHGFKLGDDDQTDVLMKFHVAKS